jgi:hypothetical protein
MTRTVRRTNTSPERHEDAIPRLYSDFAGHPNIVLLGDPGAGKTHLFREAATAEAARYIKARAFLNTPASSFQGLPLFIDGLDERRAGRGDRDTVDAIVTKLFAVNPPKVRISCRVADWLGESDLAALGPFFEQQGEVCVLHLERLSQSEQIVVLAAQGAGPDAAEAFVAEAEDRGLGDFLENPQNLIMLWRAVQMGAWPTTRKELFEISTNLMLQEFNQEHARFGSGKYTVDELRPIAGAICAARLISDVEAVSLTDQEGTPDTPSYRSLHLYPPEKVLAALGRRIFDAEPESETVDYTHRTTAEFLAAEFLAAKVRNGLPFGRVAALIGVDGHPATELRGLHAWLAVHLPERANQLIEADPYGVLTYGDAASLTKSSCAHLVKALGKLSQTDPWFRSGNWRSPAIGALSRTDMVDEFRVVLQSKDAGFGVRSLVLEAAVFGASMPELKDDLIDVVFQPQSTYEQRLLALLALLRIGSGGKPAVEAAFYKLGTDVNDLRLRAEIIQRMYGDPFGPVEVRTLLRDISELDGSKSVGGILGSLSERIPLGDIPAILDSLEPVKNEFGAGRSNELEIPRFIDSLLIRAWRGIPDLEPSRAFYWLQLRNSYSSGYSGRRTEELRKAIQEQPNRLYAITDHFFETLVLDKNRWLRFTRFREMTQFQVTPGEIVDCISTHLMRATVGSDKEHFFYELALRMTFAMDGQPASEAFEKLFDLADNRPELRAVRGASISCPVPEPVLPAQDESEHDPQALRHKFERNASAIRDGRHLGGLTWAARVYFGLFADLDESATPRQRLVTELGETNAQVAISGFIAALAWADFPSLQEVAAISAEHRQHTRWLVLCAGLMERWDTTPSLAGLTDEFLKAALAFDLVNPMYEHVDDSSCVMMPGWKEAVMQFRPELANEAYLAVARTKLAKGDQMVEGLRALMVEDAFRPFRVATALELLRDFPNAALHRLDELFDGVLTTSAVHDGFLGLADRVLNGEVSVDQQQHDMWLAAAYLLSSSRYQADLEAVATQRPSIIFRLRDRTGYSRYGSQETNTLPLPQLEFLARLTGALYPETGYPTGVFGGDTNAWDAAEYCRKLINTISAVPSEAATAALKRMEADGRMASYSPHLRHALANQERRRRELEYDRPDWPGTIKVLSNGAPATVADLHALLAAHLRDQAHSIARANTDIYKQFWNLDPHARPTEPRPEEACRDDLITLLRPSLLPLGITFEPEGHMVADKRADISVAMPARKVLCELKRDYHPDVWTALMGQLERFYAHDPEAKGFGVYCVFWFGSKRPRPIPTAPNGMSPPQSAAEMESMLRGLLPADKRDRLAIVVFDVSGDL